MIKKQRTGINLLIIIMMMIATFFITGCMISKNVEIKSDFPDSFTTCEVLNIDFTEYLTVTDVNNKNAKITEEMLDLSNVNYRKPGVYVIKVTYQSLNDEIYEKNFIITFKGNDYTAQSLKKLNVPSNIRVQEKNMSITVMFDRVPNAIGYKLFIYTPTNELILTKTIEPNDVITLNNEGNYYLTIQTLGDGKFTENSDVSGQIDFIIKGTLINPTVQLTTHNRYLQENLTKLNDGCLANGIPSLGSPKILVIPVEFTDYSLSKVGVTKTDIEKGFFGTAVDTGWESLASYYEKSSYGNLKLNGDVLPTYRTKYTATYYSNLYNRGTGGDDTVLREVLDYYDSSIDFSKYDYDQDGFIDGIYLVYAHPQDYENDNLWWAWQNWATYMGISNNYDGVRANYYMWASAGFILEGIDTGNGYDAFDYEATYRSSVKINMHTFIHETGHMFGLDDYYDYADVYDVGPTGGLGGADIMDYTVGDHCPFSKMMLGWVNPIIVLDSTTIKIKSFTETGECIMVPKDFTNNGYFGEYLTIDFYTPTGLNELDADYLFTKSAVRIMQIDSTFNFNFDIASDRSAFMYNNSDTSHKQIRYIEANGTFDIEKTTDTNTIYADNEDLFDAGEYFEVSSTKWKNLTWYDGSKMDFRITIDSIVNGVATITITRK